MNSSLKKLNEEENIANNFHLEDLSKARATLAASKKDRIQKARQKLRADNSDSASGTNQEMQLIPVKKGRR